MENIKEEFKQAKENAQNLKAKPSNETMLQLYGLNKQAMVGDVNIDKPGMFDLASLAKYSSWESKSGMTQDAAMSEYIKLVNQLLNKN